MAARKQRRSFTLEYKRTSSRLVQKVEKIAGQRARDLELTETSVRAWVRQAEVDAGKGGSGALTTAEREELAPESELASLWGEGSGATGFRDRIEQLRTRLKRGSPS